MSDRTIVIGDTHGCFDELQGLMEKCEVASDDWVISLGDMVDRGYKTKEVVDFFRRRDHPDKRSAIQGNHEERQLKYLAESKKKKPVKFSADYHADTFQALAPSDFEWFKSLPRFIRLPEDSIRAPDGLPIVLIHAGCVPQVPLEEQSDHILMHASNIELPKNGYYLDGIFHGYWTGRERTFWTSKAPPGVPFWAKTYDGSLGHVVFGHSGFLKVARFSHATGIDLGCCFGRELCALILPEWRFVTVPARAEYKKSSRVKIFEVYPGIEVFS